MRNKFHIKRLYRYLLKTFVPLFVMTFAICLFLVLMQFLWKYIEDMVGKGLGLDVLGEMFLYAMLGLIPLALPLSILLASLMAFGNLGERLELLAIKSSGISLIKTMSPLIILVTLISIGAFFFQNDAMPKINTKFYSLLISIRQKSPEVAIPAGVFYKDIDGLNIYVEKKNPRTGMLYDVQIYDISQSFEDMTVIICDSAKMEMSEDKLSLVFTMYHGQQFRNFDDGKHNKAVDREFIPYARENFQEKTLITPFDANFNRMDEEVIESSTSSNYVAKNLSELKSSIDSMTHEIDSLNVIDREMMQKQSYLTFRSAYKEDDVDSLVAMGQTVPMASPDSLFLEKDLQTRSNIMQNAYRKAESNSNKYLFRSINKSNTQVAINRHWIQWHRVFTLSFACLIFFFIGAPLGSIVRKGGLGTPIVISVILFIIYYILDNVGYKMARDGVWVHWLGMWFSSFILLPLGVFLTYKAMNDSVILNADVYSNFFKKMFFIREKRHYAIKEVVLYTPDYSFIDNSLSQLSSMIDSYCLAYENLGYRAFWLDDNYDTQLEKIKLKLDEVLQQVSNINTSIVLAKAEEYPIINQVNLFRRGGGFAKSLMYIYPLGFLIKLLSLPFKKRTDKDLHLIKKLNEELQELIKDNVN